MLKSYWETVPVKKIPSSLELYPVVHRYLQEGYKILDIGCGFGKISLELASRGYAVTGIDINSEAIGFSKIAATKLEHGQKIEGRADFNVGNAAYLPFRDSSFDFAVMQAFLTTVPDPEVRIRIIREAFRILKPGAYLYLVEFSQNWHLKLYRKHYLQDFPVTKEEGSFFALNPDTGDIEFISHHFSEKELVFLLLDGGFEIDYFRVEELKTRAGNIVNGFVVVAKKR